MNGFACLLSCAIDSKGHRVHCIRSINTDSFKQCKNKIISLTFDIFSRNPKMNSACASIWFYATNVQNGSHSMYWTCASWWWTFRWTSILKNTMKELPQSSEPCSTHVEMTFYFHSKLFMSFAPTTNHIRFTSFYDLRMPQIVNISRF